MRRIVPGFVFRLRARKAMKPVMPILLVVALIAALPSLISDAVTLMTNADPATLMTDYSNRMTQVMEAYGLIGTSLVEEVVIDEVQLTADLYTALDEYAASSVTFLKEKGPIMLALGLLVLSCSPVLTLGLNNAAIHALRGQPFTYAAALSRVRYIGKVLGLMLLFGLKTFLWTLPGVAVMLAGLLVLPESLILPCFFVGLIASVVMGVMAGYRYGMVTFILADEPTTRLRDCFRRSCEVMQQRKLELLSLEVSFIVWYLLLTMVQSALLSFGTVVGMTLGMFASLFLTVYTTCAKAAFYQEYAVGPLPEAAEEETAAAD